MEDPKMIGLSADEPFAFACGPTVDCFNECCRDLNQALTPYDVLRLKNHFNIRSSEFMESWTLRHAGPQTGLPVVTLRPADVKSRQCPFVTPDGCRVYDDRPSSCRMYPVARLATRSRETGRITESFVLLKESHCRGGALAQTQTVREWMVNQGLAPYNEMNDAMIRLISVKNRFLPGPLSPALSDLLFTVCYDIDRFREKWFAGDLPEVSTPADIPSPVADTGDEDLLRFAMRYAERLIMEKRPVDG